MIDDRPEDGESGWAGAGSVAAGWIAGAPSVLAGDPVLVSDGGCDRACRGTV